MPTPDQTYPNQHIGGHDPGSDDGGSTPSMRTNFTAGINEEHLPERLEIPGYISARRFKLEEGEGVLTYLCIWELEDGSPLHSEAL